MYHIQGSGIKVFIINFSIIILWHIIVFIACVIIPTRYFDCNKFLYVKKSWENNGNSYRKYLLINKWKDKLPQHIGKEGFSKAHLTDLSETYLDQFIMETCRAEWDHTVNIMCVVLLFVINSIWYALLFSAIVVACNTPFIIIQRYNRIRLQILKSRILDRKVSRKLKV